MASWIVVAAAGLFAPAVYAEPHHMHEMVMGETANDDPDITAQVTLVAANYGSQSYVGDYQGVIPSLMWARDRYMVGANIGLYMINENGLDQSGVGDLMLHAGVAIVQRHDVQAGLMVMYMAPTGDDRFGIGMGHHMLMPSLFGAWTNDRVTLDATAGFSRALQSVEEGHDHGVWPLVEPMNMSEITWSAGAMLALGQGLHGGVHVGGGVPVGPIIGHDRVIAGFRLGWGKRAVETAAEVQAGLVGDPFTVRGLLETALHF